MTDKPTPTDAELEALLLDKLPASKHYIRPVIEKMVAAMQAAIDKWGTPAPVGVGEVAEHYRNAIASACEGWTMPDGLRKHLETALWSQPTPQPTQAQAAEPVAWLDPWTGTKVTTDYDAYGKHGIPLYTEPQPVEREPLTDEQIKGLIEEGVFFGNCKEIVRAIEAVHGIKGGHHGTE